MDESNPLLDKLYQCLMTLTLKNMHLISSLNLPNFSCETLDLIMPFSARLESHLASKVSFPLRHLQTMIKSPFNLIFSRLNRQIFNAYFQTYSHSFTFNEHFPMLSIFSKCNHQNRTQKFINIFLNAI